MTELRSMWKPLADKAEILAELEASTSCRSRHAYRAWAATQQLPQIWVREGWARLLAVGCSGKSPTPTPVPKPKRNWFRAELAAIHSQYYGTVVVGTRSRCTLRVFRERLEMQTVATLIPADGGSCELFLNAPELDGR